MYFLKYIPTLTCISWQKEAVGPKIIWHCSSAVYVIPGSLEGIITELRLWGFVCSRQLLAFDLATYRDSYAEQSERGCLSCWHIHALGVLRYRNMDSWFLFFFFFICIELSFREMTPHKLMSAFLIEVNGVLICIFAEKISELLGTSGIFWIAF